jgi:hypothetical protein
MARSSLTSIPGYNFGRGAIQGPFHQSLVAIGPMVSEDKIKMWNIDGQTADEKWWQ